MVNPSYLLFKIPHDNITTDEAASEFFSHLSEILKGKKITVSAEIVTYGKFLWFIFVCPKGIKDIVRGQWYSQYPHIEIEEIKDFVQKLFYGYETRYVVGCELYFDQSEFLPLKTFKELKKNPLVSLSGIATSFSSDEAGLIQLVLEPPPKENLWEKIKKKIRISSRAKAADKEGNKPEYVLLEEEKEEKPYFKTTIRFISVSKNQQKAQLNLSSMLAIYKKNLERTNMQKLKEDKILSGQNFVATFLKRAAGSHQLRLTSDEIATIFHLPHKGEEISQVAQISSKKAPPPQNLASDGDFALFAQTNFQNQKKPFGIKTEDRRRHLYIIGKTGMGKSKLLELLMLSDLRARRGLILLDPHGDLAQEVLRLTPAERKNDVVYFNPQDSENPVGFNPMECVGSFEFKQNIVAGFISIFKKLFGFNWNERLEHVFRYTTLALLDYPSSNVLGITRMLTDNLFRQEVITYISDPLVKKFWATEFASWNEQFSAQAIAPIVNNVGQFIANPVIRNIVGQSKTGFSLDEVMNKEKILIANLSIGKLGEENSALLGSMLITKIWQTAIARTSIPEEERKDTFLYVDEFQNFATTAFSNILSEARKYRLNLTIAHQYMQQLPTEVRATIFGNVGNIISFRVGGEDAQILAKEFEPVFNTNDFLNLDVRNIYLKISISGQTARPFSGQTITLTKPEEDRSREIIELSRKKYSKTKKQAGEEIERWEKGKIRLEKEVKKEEAKEEAYFPEPII